MITTARQQANHGTARSFATRRTYGLGAQNVIAGVEDKREFEKMAAGFHAEFEPQDQSGRVLFDELVTAAWQLRRIRRMEAECCLDAESYRAMLSDETLQQRLDRLARHHSRVERTFHRCLRELKSTHDEYPDAEARLSAGRFRRRLLAVATNISERTQLRIQPGCENNRLAA